ncbi:MAG: Nmad3 family putative nucleotide modification protein [Acidiferrobacter sp.]
MLFAVGRTGFLKIIFSRKGFDSGYGGVPSPILPDGTLVSFPIPSKFGRPLSDLRFGNEALGKMVAELTGGKITTTRSVHLDPDLVASTVVRQPGWSAVFGQTGSAQGHLRNQGVGAGDLFLFFGWYQRVEHRNGKIQYTGPQIHSLFGWLQIGEVLQVTDSATLLKQRPWLADHPHLQYAASIGANNTVYLATRQLKIGNTCTQVAGAGVFNCWSPLLQLTAPGQSRSVWQLPGWMFPANGRSALSYHPKTEAWERRPGDLVWVRTAAKGQEFVLRTPDLTAAQKWLEQIFEQESMVTGG